MSSREPRLLPVPVAELRPTQVTIGLREVRERRREWRDQDDAQAADYLGRHMIPVLKGPKGRLFVIDHHHLTRALVDDGATDILTNVVADLSRLDKSEFWTFCDNRGWCHPYDAEGERVAFKDIPKTLAAMTDDPFRSLAGALRRAGGFAKDTTPFSEFVWADFLRRRVKAKLVQEDFATALTQALTLAKETEADHLPGWCGPTV